MKRTAMPLETRHTKVMLGSAFLASALACAAPHARADLSFGPGLPQLAGCASMDTVNATSKWLWITIYDLAQIRHLDYGWVAPYSTRSWRSGNYSCAGVYHVRAEVKSVGMESTTGGGSNIGDTRMEVKGSNHVVYLQSNVFALRSGGTADANTSFWWDRNQRPAKTPIGTVDLPALTVANASPKAMWVRVNFNPDLQGQQQQATCIASGAEQPIFLWAGNSMLRLGFTDTCGQFYNIYAATTDFPVNVAWGQRLALAYSGKLAQGPGSWGAAQLFFTNLAPQPVQFVLDGHPDKSPCVEPGKTSAALTLAAGPQKVTPFAKARCADTAAGWPSAASTVTVSGATQKYIFAYTLSPR